MQNSDKKEMPEKNLKRYYIVKEHPIRIISKCKSHSQGTLGSYLIGFCLLYAVINWVPQVLSLFFPTTNLDLMAAYMDADPALLSRLPATPLVMIIYMLLFNGAFKMSECLYALTYIRNRKVDYRALSESLPFFFKTLRLYLLQTVLILLWTMLFIIPGILAIFNYSQSFYILADDPDKSVTQVLIESKMMMYGNRMNYFRLIVCYLPYYLIGYLPALLLASAAASFEGNTYAVLLISMISDIPMFVVYGFVSLGRTVFYELMINKGFAYFKYAGQQAFRELENPEQF